MSIAQDIPTVDLDDLASDRADRRERGARALELGYGTFGLVYIRGHGIDRSRVESLYDAFLEVLERPETEKRSWGGEAIWYQRGWTPPNTEKAVVAGGEPDFKECFFASTTPADEGAAAAWPELYADNVWPEGAPGFREGLMQTGQELHGIGSHLLRGCAEALGFERDELVELTRGGANVTRILKYLALDQRQVDAGTLWGEEHTDFNLLTLLPGGRLHDPSGAPGRPEQAGGLRLRTRSSEEHPRGIQVRGAPPEGCIVSQVGQQLEILTGGTFHATPHIITAPRVPGWTRVSLAHFMHVHAGRVLEPRGAYRNAESLEAYGPPVLAGTYAVKTLVDIGLAPTNELNRLGYRHYDRLATMRAAKD